MLIGHLHSIRRSYKTVLPLFARFQNKQGRSPIKNGMNGTGRRTRQHIRTTFNGINNHTAPSLKYLSIAPAIATQSASTRSSSLSQSVTCEDANAGSSINAGMRVSLK